MPTPIQKLTALYKNNLVLAARLRDTLRVAASEDITEARVTASLVALYGNASDETIALATMGTKVFLLIDETSMLRLKNAAMINHIKSMLRNAGAVVPAAGAGATFRDNSPYYDFIMQPQATVATDQKLDLLGRIISYVQSQERSQPGCAKVLEYMDKAEQPPAAEDFMQRALNPSLTGADEKAYKLNNEAKFDRQLEFRDFKICVDDSYVDIRLPFGLTPTLIKDKLEVLKEIRDADGREVGLRLYKDLNIKIRTILLAYQRTDLPALERDVLDARLKAALTILAVRLREHKRPMVANELLCAAHDGDFQDDKLNGIFRKPRDGETKLAVSDSELVVKANTFFDRIKGFTDNLRGLLGVRAAGLPELTIDVDAGIDNVIEDIKEDEFSNIQKRRFLSTVARLRETVKSIEALDAANAALVGPDLEISALRQEQGRKFLVDFDRLRFKSSVDNKGHDKSFINPAAKANTLSAEETKGLRAIAAEMTAMSTDKSELHGGLEILVTEPLASGATGLAALAERREQKTLLANTDKLIKMIAELLLLVAKNAIKEAEELAKNCRELNTSIDQTLKGVTDREAAKLRKSMD